MGRPRKTVSDDTQADTPRGPSRIFARRSAGDRGALTHDTLAADMDAFRLAGGKIEVLGTTATLRKIGQTDTAGIPAATNTKATRQGR
jgi:hypothetical protein